jgi:acyl-CoA synthetase (AMP-forming)/AMP-acid ligase II
MPMHTSPYAEIEIPDLPVHGYVLAHAATYGDRVAMVDGPSGRTYTYAQVLDAVRRTAGGLTRRGFGREDVLALIAPNLPEYAIVFHAVSMAGGTVTTVNPTYGAEEIAFQLRDADARLAVTVPPVLDPVSQAAEQAGVRDVIVLRDTDAATGVPLAALFDEPFEQELAIDPAQAIAVLPYSSGTTGMPKGVMLSHRNLVANIAQVQPLGGYDPDGEVFVAVLPFFHIYGMQVLMNGALRIGATLVTMPRFDLEQFLALVEEHRVTRAYVVPPIVLALAKHPLVDRYDLSSLRQVLSGAAPLGSQLAGEAAARVGCEVVQGYGLTETSPFTNFTPVGGFKPGTVGVLVPNTQLRLVDRATGEDCEVGHDGEICFRGPQVMQGYLGDPEATAAMIDEDGWLHTGDVGHIDSDGHLTITDRLKELIKYKGFQVAPAELEALLVTHPAVADVAVIGMPDTEAGEVPKAFVVPAGDVTAQDIIAFTAERLAHYKQVRQVTFVDEIPKSPSGKILRRILRDRDRTSA